jgi:hypothetical protein
MPKIDGLRKFADNFYYKKVAKIVDVSDRFLDRHIYFRFCTTNGTVISYNTDTDIEMRTIIDCGAFYHPTSWIIEDGYYPVFDKKNNYVEFYENGRRFVPSIERRGVGFDN